MRVLFITRKWVPAVGGMETYSVELSAALDRREDIALDVIKLPGRPDGRPPSWLAILGFFLRCAVVLAFRGRRYDVVHFGDLVLVGLARWSRLFTDATQVVALHGLDVVYGKREGMGPALYRRYVKFSVSSAPVDCFVANSRNTGRLLEEQQIGPVEVVPLAVALDRDRDPIPPGAFTLPPFLLFFGRIFRRKGVRWFAENVLPELPPELTLAVVGSVWDEDDAAVLRTHPRVRMLGAFPIDMSIEDFGKLKREAVAIVMPNVNNADGQDVEGFGLAALEAADNGAPLVASSLEGITDAVVDGVTGFLEPPEDTDAWVARITELLSWDGERRSEFAARARQLLLEQYSWERVAADYASVYRQSGSKP